MEEPALPRVTIEEINELCGQSLPWAVMMGFEIAEVDGPVAQVTAHYSIPPERDAG